MTENPYFCTFNDYITLSSVTNPILLNRVVPSQNLFSLFQSISSLCLKRDSLILKRRSTKLCATSTQHKRAGQTHLGECFIPLMFLLWMLHVYSLTLWLMNICSNRGEKELVFHRFLGEESEVFQTKLTGTLKVFMPNKSTAFFVGCLAVKP